MNNPEPVVLDVAGGELRVNNWPATGPKPPFGLHVRGGQLLGPARLRAATRRAITAAGLPLRDLLEQPPIVVASTALSRADASVFEAWHLGGGQGLTTGLTLPSRMKITIAASAAIGHRTLVVTADSAAEHCWRRGLANHCVAQCTTVVTAAAAAHGMHWLGRRHDLLVVDSPELIPAPALTAVLDGSPARWRLGFVGSPEARGMLVWCRGIGPLVGIVDGSQPATCIELRVPMPPVVAAAHETAWHTFFGAFDRFAALQPEGGFGTFVRQARGDPVQRPALSAWHEALRLASWHAHKADALRSLLQRHRGERMLLFTPDRASAYAIARQHLVAPVTAELSRREREQTLDDFVAGTLRVLAGPRLLDLGVPDGIADVGILIGGGFGRAQRAARCRRVSPRGLVYELVSLDTVEVGRAQRWRGTAAAATAVVPDD